MKKKEETKINLCNISQYCDCGHDELKIKSCSFSQCYGYGDNATCQFENGGCCTNMLALGAAFGKYLLEYSWMLQKEEEDEDWL